MKTKLIKKYMLLFVTILVIVSACKDDSLQVVPAWESAVHGFIAVPTGGQKSFFYKNAAPVALDYKWNSIDGKLAVAKIEFYVQFNEPYKDLEGNSKLAAHGGDKGILLKTLEGSGVPANRTNISFNVSQTEVYELYKNAAFDYDGDKVATPVFNNPAKPERIAAGRFAEGDEFKVTWILYTDDGRVFNTWAPSVCTEFPGANCSYDWVVECPFGSINDFTGNYSALEPGYGTYDVTIALKAGSTNTVIVNNWWDAGASIEYVINSTSKTVTIPSQSFVSGGINYLVSGSGTINTCNGSMIVPYTVTNSTGTTVIDANTHTYTRM